MSKVNKTTLESYEKAIDKYVQGTASVLPPWVIDWLQDSLKGLGKDAQILEIGSGFGRDAKYIGSLGYKVERTDAVQGFISVLQKDDPTAHNFNAIEDDLSGNYDLVFANAVFLHFTREETEAVSKKVLDSLNDGGRLAISLKQGDGEEWSTKKVDEPRYFCYWQKDDIEALLYKTGFSEVTTIIDSNDTKNNNTWLMVVAYKSQSEGLDSEKLKVLQEEFTTQSKEQGLFTCIYSDKPNEVSKPHSHASATLLTLEGSAKVRLDEGSWRDIVPGDIVHIKDDQLHEVIAGDKGWKYLFAASQEEALRQGLIG